MKALAGVNRVQIRTAGPSVPRKEGADGEHAINSTKQGADGNQ
jgi:hypothetical protein